MSWKTLFSICAICCMLSCRTDGYDRDSLASAGVSRELAEYRKDRFSDVRYDLRFSIPESRSERVSGEVELKLSVDEKSPIIVDFRADSDQVLSVMLNGKTIPYEVRNEHIIIAPGLVEVGENHVNISFIAADQSLNRRDEFLYTLLVPDRARTLFPCFDQPDMKSLFSLTLEVPSSWQAVANGAILAEEIVGDGGSRRITFKETEPLSTYLFSFVAGELKRQSFSRDGREISIYHRETDPDRVAQCPDIASEVFDALEWLEDYTAVPYPFAKYDLIILPGFQYGGMEHTGATLYADRRMFVDKNPTLNERLSRSALIAHETSHMWFGDYVTMKWFDDVWTKEVFANYFASRIVEPLFPDVNHRLNFIRDYIPSSYSEDRTAGANPIKQDLENLRDAGLVYGNIIYNKSPVVMEMLVRMLGEDAFRDGIREYLKSYAYGNATWDGLIGILDKYTDHDLAKWSEVWVNQKGMPQISASLVADELIVEQSDPLARGLRWPQELTYRLVGQDGFKDIKVAMSDDSSRVSCKLTGITAGEMTIVPNVDGRGYGFFKLDETMAARLWERLRNSTDEVERGSILINLYENLRRRSISADNFREAITKYLPEEQNPLLFSMALGYLGDCQHLFPADSEPLEEALWRIVSTDRNQSRRIQAFRRYRSLADSDEAVDRLYRIWENESSPNGCQLSESDFIALSYGLAIRMPERADEIVATQLSRIKNPDRRREYSFISPSVSPRMEVRDSLFNALLIAENRRVEPWASSALSYLNHRLRESESIKYIAPALAKMREVQRTGDIFFPKSWAGALLSGHISEEARREVDAFFEANPDYPLMLSNKIRQQADHLYR